MYSNDSQKVGSRVGSKHKGRVVPIPSGSGRADLPSPLPSSLVPARIRRQLLKAQVQEYRTVWDLPR